MPENKITEELLELFEGLSDEEWEIKVNSNWTIKDVLSHFVGWEEESAASLADSFATRKTPWFLNADEKEFDEFNRMSVLRYVNYKPVELIERWKYLMRVFESEINQVGIDKIKANPKLFDWVFDESHYEKHLEQIRKAVSKVVVRNKNI